VVSAPGYRSRGPRFDAHHYQIFFEVLGLKRFSPKPLRIIEELLERKVVVHF
jgi:hypothetical protein